MSIISLVVGLLILLAIGMGVVSLGSTLIRTLFGGSDRQSGGVSMGHTTLTCPHCQQETRAGVPTCSHCGNEL